MASKLSPGVKQQKDEERREKKAKQGGIAAAVVGAVLVAGALIAQKALKRKSKGPKQLINPCKVKAKRKPTAEHPLADVTLVVSPLLIQGQGGSVPADSTAPAVQLLVNAGIELIGTTSTEELQLGLQSQKSAIFNAVMPESAATGTGSGIAAAVAAGLADCGLGVDHMTGLKVHASMAGLYAYRASIGSVESSGTTPVAGSLDSLGLVAHDPETLLRLGRALQLPGASFHKTKLLKLVVAEDLFSLCDDATQDAKRALKLASQRWPGKQYVQTTNLLSYLDKLVPSAKEFEERVLEGIQGAATALSYREYAKAHSRQPSMGAELAAELLQQQLDICSELSDNNAVLRKASAVKSEVAMAMRDLLRDGSVYIIPVLPGPKPDRRDSAEMDDYEAKVTQFGAIASLAGIPQVTMPVKIAGQVVSLAILGMGRSDMSLLGAVARLAPLVAMAAAKLSQPTAEPTPEPAVPAAEEPAVAEESGDAMPEEPQAEEDAKLDSHALDHLYSNLAGDLYNTGNSVVGQPAEGGNKPEEPAIAEPQPAVPAAEAELGGKLPRESSGVVRLTANAGLPEGAA